MTSSPETASPAPEYMSTIEVAQLLGLAVRSVQLMVDRGELEAWRTSGGHRRIVHESVMKWLASRQRDTMGNTSKPFHLSHGSKPKECKILLIEDSAHFQNLVTLLIKQHFPGASLHLASDGISGLTKFGQIQPDFLLVDILLPGIDGAALISTLKSDPQFARCKLIIVTGLSNEQLTPYEFALRGLPVIHKTNLVTELVPLLSAQIAQHLAS